MGLSLRLIATAASLSLYALSGHAEEFHISVLQSTTGPAAFVGKPLTDGIALAVEDVNAGQMLGAGNTLVATYADDGGDRGQAVTLLKRAAADPRVSIVIGPTTAQLGVAASNAANDAHIPIYTSGAVRDTLNAGPWAFLITPLPEDFIGEIADFAAKKLHVKKCVIMTILDSEAYISLAKGFQKIVAENGTDVLAYEGVKQSDTDFSAIAVKVVGLKPDCVFVSAPAAQAANIVVQLRQAGLAAETRIIGHTTFSSPEFLATGGTAVEGAYYLSNWAPDSSDASIRFIEKYKARFGTEPDSWAALGYSAAMVVADALKRSGPNPDRARVRDEMRMTRDVPVLVGHGRVTFNPDRTPYYGMNVMMIRNGRAVLAP